MQLKTIPVVLTIAAAAMAAGAQDSSVRLAENPFQEGAPYSIGDELAIDVDIQGIWWTTVVIEPKADDAIQPDAEVDVIAKVGFDNRAGRNVRLAIVLMLEDEAGKPLERLTFPSFKLPARRVREYQHQFSVPGSDLVSTRRIYLFCQVE